MKNIKKHSQDFKSIKEFVNDENYYDAFEITLQQDRTDIYNEILSLFNNSQDIEIIKQEIIKLKDLNTTLD